MLKVDAGVEVGVGVGSAWAWDLTFPTPDTRHR
jgi:hypothetical protein